MRASTPLRKLSPTPLDRHRSREPSPFVMPRLKLGSGTITPGGSKPADPHTYFSRSNSSQSLHHGGLGGSQTFQGGIGATNLDFDSFRAAMEAKQADEDDVEPPATTSQPTTHTQSMTNISSWRGSSSRADPDHLCPVGMFSMERPSSAMSEVSIHMGDLDLPSRADSRMETFPLGDAISHGHLAYTEDVQSNLSSRRGSELQSLVFKDNKTSSTATWRDKDRIEAEKSDMSSVAGIEKDSKKKGQQVSETESRKEKFSTAQSLKKNTANLESAVQAEESKTSKSEKQNKAKQAKAEVPPIPDIKFDVATEKSGDESSAIAEYDKEKARQPVEDNITGTSKVAASNETEKPSSRPASRGKQSAVPVEEDVEEKHSSNKAVNKDTEKKEEKKVEEKPVPKWKMKPAVEEPKPVEEKKVEEKPVPKWKKKPVEEPKPAEEKKVEEKPVPKWKKKTVE